MPSESGERRTARTPNNSGPHPPPKLAERLPCARCKSSDTKFCYYNNYNLAQPRHFCKACRRYWTEGGTLRNVPVGGSTRKNSKRSRSSSSSTNSTSSSSTTNTNNCASKSEPLLFAGNPESTLPMVKCEISSENKLDLNENLPGSESGNLISLIDSQQEAGFMGTVGYGSNVGYELCDIGVGFGGRAGWAYPGMGYISGGGGLEVGNFGDGHELFNGDCFSWPSLAISTPPKGLK